MKPILCKTCKWRKSCIYQNPPAWADYLKHDWTECIDYKKSKAKSLSKE